MPLIYENQISTVCKTYVWQITESIDELTLLLMLNSKELDELDNTKFIEKKLQWLATKTLLQQIFKTNQRIKINKNKFGKPFLVDLPFQYTLSHSREYVAISISKNAIGVDIELIRNKIERITAKFMSKTELENTPELNPQDYFHVIWGAKEAMFKLYGNGELNFKDHLIITPFIYNINGGEMQAHIIKEGINIQCKIDYQRINECILVTAEQII